MAQDRAHDWELVARRDPFFGVLSQPEFRLTNLSPENRRRFYDSGEADVSDILAMFESDAGARPAGGRALDIGCGAGRLTRAMAAVMTHVTGYDVSPTMLEAARDAMPENVDLTTVLPNGPFDWINSYIVFQHIPPAEGLALLARCLAAAGPDCLLSLQVTVWRDGELPGESRLARWRDRLRRLAGRFLSRRAEPLISMYGYNLNEIVRRLTDAGFARLVLRHTRHGGHHGVWIIARRAQADAG